MDVEKVLEGYRGQLSDLRSRARRAAKPHEFLGVYDGVKNIIESDDFDNLDMGWQNALYKDALDIYGLAIKALHTDLTQAKADISARDERIGVLVRGRVFQ